jgi:hypothetical protein
MTTLGQLTQVIKLHTKQLFPWLLINDNRMTSSASGRRLDGLASNALRRRLDWLASQLRLRTGLSNLHAA